MGYAQLNIWLILLSPSIGLCYFMRKIMLTKGFYTLIDDDDFEKIDEVNLQVNGDHCNKPYATYGNPSRQVAYLIIDCPEGMTIDHINGNSLDNRKENLRVVTKLQNRQHQASWKENDFKGVKKIGDKYTARIFGNGVRYYLGMFNTAQEAADAYDKKAEELFGEFAYLNRNKHLYVDPMTFRDEISEVPSRKSRLYLTEKKLNYIKDNIGKISNRKIADDLNICYVTLSRVIRLLDIKRPKNYIHSESGKQYKTVSEVAKDFPNLHPRTIWGLMQKDQFIVKKIHAVERLKMALR